MKIVVLSPREEHWDGSGGAIANWTEKVQVPATPNLTVLGSSPANRRTWYFSPRRLQLVNTFIASAAAFLTRFFPMSEKKIENALWIRGFLYVLLLLPEIQKADLVYIHNRPRYAKFLRTLGYRGKLVIHMHNKVDSYFRRFPPRQVQRIDLFLFCSEFIRRQAVENFNLPLSRTSVVYNGVDESAIPEPSPMSFSLLFVGRMQEIKGPDIAIEVVSVLRTMGHDATLCLIGGTEIGLHTSSTPYLSSLLLQAESINQTYGTETIKFLGPLPLPEVLDQMAKYPLFIFPARWEEAFGMVVAESISRGAHPVVSPRGGIPEILSIAGIAPLAEHVNPEDLAKAIIDAQENVSIQDRKAASSRILATLNWRMIREEYAKQMMKLTKLG